MNLDDMYQEVILDHYRSPHGRGLSSDFDAEVHHVNPTCGDEITVRVKLDNDGTTLRVAEVSHEGQGCSISQASASVMYDQINGQSLRDAMAAVDEFGALMKSATTDYEANEDILGDAIAFVGVARYPARIKCALLAWMAFKDAAAQATAVAQAGEGQS